VQTIPVRPSEGSAGSGQDKPAISYWHVWIDEHGVSHQTRCELRAFEHESISSGAAPAWIDRLSISGATALARWVTSLRC
jgi:hypothetical protein